MAADGHAAPIRALPLPETAPGRYETTFRPDIETGALLLNVKVLVLAGEPNCLVPVEVEVNWNETVWNPESGVVTGLGFR